MTTNTDQKNIAGGTLKGTMEQTSTEDSQRKKRIQNILQTAHDLQSNHLKEYFLRLQVDPTSCVFVPVAEYYRRNGKLEEAIDIAKEGVEYNPEYHIGRITLAKCYLDKKLWNDSKRELELVLQIQPENLLAQKILGDLYFLLEDYNSSLNAYKIAALLSPTDSTITEKIHEIEAILSKKKTPSRPSDSIQTNESIELFKEEEQEEETEAFHSIHVQDIFNENRNENFNSAINTETLGDLYFSQKQFDQALRIFEKINMVKETPDLENKINQCRVALGIDIITILHKRKVQVLRSILYKLHQT